MDRSERERMERMHEWGWSLEVEQRWCSECAAGREPRPGRLGEEELSDPALPARLAIDYVNGVAGYRPVRHDPHTSIWYWPRRDGSWWLVPAGIEYQALNLVLEAIRDTMLREGTIISRQKVAESLRLKVGNI